MDRFAEAARSQGDASRVPDPALVLRIVNRDQAALAEVYDRYGSLVYGVALRVLRDAPAAEEVLQDTFHRLWRMAARFDPARGSLPAWLAVTARHRAIDYLRRREPESEPDSAAAEVAIPFDLEEQILRNGLMDRVRGALERLPDAQRSLVELAYFQGMTHSELAERTGEPLGTVKTRLRAAMAGLRKDLEVILRAAKLVGR
jgi:RNA polymerase sigma-70 factor (ECF subfamily)